MDIIFSRPTIYMSHAIRGANNDIAGNCKKAEAAARRLRRVFPDVDFYVPAEHDLTLQILTAEEKLSIDDVMFADLAILRACNGYMYYKHQRSSGSEIELQEALGMGLCNYLVSSDFIFYYDIEKASYAKLRKDFDRLICATIKQFKTRSDNHAESW